MNWEKLTSKDELNVLDQASHTQPVLIFKHSTKCSISAASLNRLERNWDSQKAGNIKSVYLDLLTFREISNEIAHRYDIEHQSPQVLLIKDGKCVYTTSHFGISFSELLQHKDLASSTL